MSDAQVDGGDKGQQGEDIANNFIGDKDAAQAVRWYGIYSMITGFGSIFAYMILNNESTYVILYNAGFKTRIAFYVPVAMAWLMVSFFDGDQMREIFGTIVAISILGPFFFQWYYFGLYLLSGEGWAYDELMFYVWGAIFFSWTVFESIIQIVLLPRVFDWIEDGATLDNDQEKEDENLMALVKAPMQAILDF